MYLATVFHQQLSGVRFEESDGVPYHTLNPVGYVKCQTNERSELNKAYQYTNTIDCYWGDNRDVQDYNGRNRSTSIGDFILLDGRWYQVWRFGFGEYDQRGGMLWACSPPVGMKFAEDLTRSNQNFSQFPLPQPPEYRQGEKDTDINNLCKDIDEIKQSDKDVEDRLSEMYERLDDYTDKLFGS